MLNSQPLTRIALLAVLSIGLVGAVNLIWPQVKSRQERQLARRLISDMELSDSASNRVLLRQIASLGDSSLEALVMAAASKRADVALQARQIIGEKLGTWKTTAEVDPSFDLAQPTRMLASTLATHIHEFGPLGGQWSSSLALELVGLADGLPAEDAAALLADCSNILNQIPALGPRMRTLNPGKNAASAKELQISSRGQPEPSLLDVPSERAIASKVAAPTHSTDDSAVESLPASKSTEDQSTLLPSTLEWALESAHTTATSISKEQYAFIEGHPTSSHLKTRDEMPMGTSTNSLIDVPTPDDMEASIAAMHNESTRTLIEQLATADFYTAGAIRLVLRERGISDEELSVVDRLLSSEPADRLRLVDDLKVLPARPARRWLHVLLEDKNAEVRLEALTALATTKDPDLVGLAREMAVNDQDTRVSELASRIMREAR